MISDVLFDAIEEIRRYRTDPVFAESYADPELSARLDRLVADMDAMRAFLDTPPDVGIWKPTDPSNPGDVRLAADRNAARSRRGQHDYKSKGRP
jgi:hypothetical protein